MRTDCKTIRREIDEASLDDRLTREVDEHLNTCDQCRRFHNDRRTLRNLMADLEPVGAPADFDFRLRARLAREKPSNGFGRLFLRAGPITAVAMLVLIGAMLVVVKNRMSSAGESSIPRQTAAAKDAAGANAVPSPTVPELVSPSDRISPKDVAAGMGGPSNIVPNKPQNVRVPRNTVAHKGSKGSTGVVPRFNVRDSAGEGAPRITPDTFAGLVVVPVDARELKLSIDNGRGGARTISLPPVTFGSQRLLARDASFMPASSARSDW